ncbi:Sorbitol dehydrogenase [Halotydeus destructor]|nr:Sorbitol dehydrogenase [Halotydeus destructor]
MDIKENLAVVLHKAGDMRLDTVPLPPAPGADEVQLTTNFCGLCGTDIHVRKTGEIGPFVLERPVILGHEASATVVNVGSNVTHLKVGDKVTIEPAIPCNNCQHCREGNYNWCDVCNKQCRGLPHYDGLLQRLYNHPAAYCYKLPDTLDLRIGALGEPMAVIVHAVRRIQVSLSQNILVTGAGTMGLLALKVAKANGAGKVAVVDINGPRLELAKKIGADVIYQLGRDEDPIEAGIKVRELVGEPIDSTLECTGAEACLRLSIEATRMGGKVALVGLGKPLIQVPIAQCSLKEIDLLGVCRFRNCFPMAVKMLSTLDLAPIVTHTFKLEDVFSAFATMERGEGLKVVVDCQVDSA